MGNGQLDLVLRYLRTRFAGTARDGDVTDQQLLERFTTRHEEAVFEALLQRHGPMVLGVCQRVLNQEQDAEDAFQATFLVLARQAHTIRRHASVGSWLYGVAQRVALKAKALAARRRAHERCVMRVAQTEPEGDWHRRELRAVLDEELQRLPEKYRAPLVLCYLEGKTNAEAARALGWPLGTISKRLARARERLRDRLVGRGFALSLGLLGTVLEETTVRAAVPAALRATTLRTALLGATGKVATASVSASATTLAEGVLQAMRLTKAMIVTGTLLAVTGIGLGVGAIVQRTVLAQAPSGNAQTKGERSEKPKPGPFTATLALAKGVTVELLGVVQNAPIERRTAWWKPDGSALPMPPYKEPGTYSNEANPYEFAFRVPGKAGYSFTAAGPAGTSTSEPTIPRNEARQLLPEVRTFVVARLAPEAREITIRLGLATQAWQVVEKWADYPWAPGPGIIENASDVILTWPRLEADRVVVDVTHTSVADASRLVAYDQQGKLYEAQESSGGRGKSLIRRVYRFGDLKLEDVQRFEFQRRRYDTWITFKNVSLKPGHQTKVQVEMEHPPPPRP